MAIGVGAALLGSAAIGGISSWFNARSASKGQEDANRMGMEFNAKEAQKNRDWQEQMFGSRYQTTRSDLEKAGYNPLLAFGNPGVTPSGATARSDPKSTKAVSSGIRENALNRVKQAMLLGATIDKMRSEARSAKAQASLNEQEEDIRTSKWGKRFAWLNYAMRSGIAPIAGGVGGMFSARRIASAIGRRPNITLREGSHYKKG